MGLGMGFSCCCQQFVNVQSFRRCDILPETTVVRVTFEWDAGSDCFDERVKVFFYSSHAGGTWNFVREERDGDGITGTLTAVDYGVGLNLRVERLQLYRNGDLWVDLRYIRTTDGLFEYCLTSTDCGEYTLPFPDPSGVRVAAFYAARAPLVSELASLTWTVTISGVVGSGTCGAACTAFNGVYVYGPTLTDLYGNDDKVAIGLFRSQLISSPPGTLAFFSGTASPSNCDDSVGNNELRISPGVCTPTVQSVGWDYIVPSGQHPTDPLTINTPAVLHFNSQCGGDQTVTANIVES